MGGCVLTLVGLLAACGSKSGGGSIACDSDADCPNELVCDVEAGVCVDPDDGDPYTCRPPVPGCACDGDPPVSCLVDRDQGDLVASCREGQSLCEDGEYQACEEVSNPFCSQVGVSSGDFDPTFEDSSNVELGPEGEIVLDPDVRQVEFGFVWVANTGENTVSKLDIDTGREVARYAAVRNSGALGIPAVPVGGFDGDESNCGNCPSRTAIDFHGDAFVANRAFGLQGTISKFANDTIDCTDRNGNGVIDTSVDINDDGVIDVNSPSEFLGEGDECILWTVPVGGNDGVPRGLAIDAGGPDGEDGNVWVGLYNEQRVIALSGDTGAPLTDGGADISVGTDGLYPYGCAVDGFGNLWVTGIQDTSDETFLAKVNTFNHTLTGIWSIPDDDDGCSKGYGIAIDTDQRIWLGGWDCNDAKAFDQLTEEWIRRDFDDIARTRGVAVDTAGHVWVAFDDGRVGKVVVDDIVAQGNNAPVELYTMPTIPGADTVDNTIGVGIDRNGACWAVSRNDETPLGTATRIDTAGNVEAFPVGHRPYTYSDFTGFGLSTVVRPTGFWRGKIEGCATTNAVSEWQTLEWFEREPPGTSVRLRVRVADTLDGLDGAAWFGPWDDSPVDLEAEGVPPARFMQIEAQLSTTDPDVTPAFLGFTVSFDCPGVGPVE